MRNSHYLLYGVALATLGLVVVAPAGASQGGGASGQTEAASSNAPISPEQQAEIDRWPPDMQSAYSAWPPETKTYYWSLALERKQIFWRLRDQDKVALTAMTGPEREAAWDQIKDAVAAQSGE